MTKFLIQFSIGLLGLLGGTALLTLNICYGPRFIALWAGIFGTLYSMYLLLDSGGGLKP